MKKYLGLIVITFLLLSCGQTANISTSIPTTNSTLLPRYEKVTEIISITTNQLANLPTNINTHEITKTSIPLPTQTMTLFMEPPAQTAAAKTQAQEMLLSGKTATAIEKSIRVTRTVEARSQQRTSTQIANQNKIATAVAYKTMIAQYQTVEAKKLITYPGDYEGQYVRFDLKIFNFIDESTLQGWIIGGYYDPVIVSFRTPYRDIYEDEIITVFGVVAGKQSGFNSFGGEVNQLLIKDAWFRK
jgi:hypothetical protein